MFHTHKRMSERWRREREREREGARERARESEQERAREREMRGGGEKLGGVCVREKVAALIPCVDLLISTLR